MTQSFDGNDGVFSDDAATYGYGNGHVTAELVAAYADRELEPASALEVERHVGGCPVCQESLRLQHAVRERLGQEPAAGVPFALRDRVFAAVRAAPAPALSGAQARAHARWRHRPIIGALTRHPAWGVAAVLAVIVVATYSWERFGPGREQVAAVERPGGVAGEKSDSAAVVQLIRNHAIAWNDRDAKAAADLVTTDAVWVTSTGAELRGREAIEQAHAQWLAEDAGGGATTHVHRPESINVRFLRPDVAVADLEGQFFLPAAIEEQPGPAEEARIFIVATWDGKAWRISQLRNLKRHAVGPTQR